MLWQVVTMTLNSIHNMQFKELAGSAVSCILSGAAYNFDNQKCFK